MAATRIHCVHLVSPIVRCVSNVRPRDAHDSPFSNFLKVSRIDRPGDTFKLSAIHELPQPADRPQAGQMSAPLLPSLGEVLDVEPRAKLAGIETRLHQQLVPATGRALDIYA